MQGKHNGKEDENSEDEKITTIQFHPCSEFRDVSQERKAQVWVYYLFNEKTQESKCRYCGNIWNFKKGKKVFRFSKISNYPEKYVNIINIRVFENF